MSAVDDSIKEQLAAFLDEDLGRGDITSEALIDASRGASARVVAREAGVVAGVDESVALCKITNVACDAEVNDGDDVSAQQVVLRLTGTGRAVLGVERTLLNLLSHMSGVATLTRRATDIVRNAAEGADTVPRVAATRKTLPGLRAFQKRAVELGGGWPHRFDLSEAVLIKDNHLALVGDVAVAVERAKTDARIEIEVENVDDALAAARAGADILMLDNMSPDAIGVVVTALEEAGLRQSVVLEASGGITMDNVGDYAGSGVDLISMGSLTASARYLDFSLEVDSS